MDVQRVLERRQNKPGRSSGTGTQTTHPNPHQQETSDNSADPLFHIFPEDLTSEAVDSTPMSTPMTSAQEDSTKASAHQSDEVIEKGRETVLEREEGEVEAVQEKSHEEGEGSDDDRGFKEEASLGKTACSSGETPRPIPVDITLLQRNLTQERQRAEMWRHLYLWEREGKRGMNASACLQFLLREVNMTRLMETLGHWNLTGVGMEGVKDLTSLVTSMARLHQHLLHSLPALWHDLSANLNDLHGDLSQPEPPPSESDPEKGPEEEEEEKVTGDPPPHTPWSEGVKTLLNKTRGTLSNVSRHLKQTWDQVKDVSRHLWPGNDSVFGRIAARVKDGMNKLSHRMKGTGHKKRSKMGKQGWKKKRQEAFSGGEEREGGERERDRNGQEKENTKDHQKKSQFQQKKGDGGKKWKTERPQNVGEDRLHDVEEKSQNVSSHQKDHSHHRRKEHADKHHHKKSDKEDGKSDEQLDKHDPKDANHKESKNETPGKHYRNDSQRKYAKQYHHSENQQDPHFKDKEGKKRHWKENASKKNKEQKYRHDDMEKDKRKKHDKERQTEDKDRRHGDHAEQQFSTKAKHHSSHAEKATDKARHKMQKRFHKLFTKIGAMNHKSFTAMERDDLAEMLEDITEVFKAYSDSKHLGLPHSGFLWLQCQHHFWRKAERGRVRYEPEEGCVQFLAPWQIGFVVDLRERVQKGECRKERIISCVDGGGPEEDTESYYKYVCSEDDRHHDDDDDDDDDSHHTSHKQESQAFPKGQRERENTKAKLTPQESWNTDSSKESANKQVNHSEQDSQAWYFHWVEGRNNLRSVEHKADWLFERAQERDETREQERRANWMFERASERDKLREEGQKADWKVERAADRYAGYEDHDDDDDDDDDEMEDEHGRWHEGGWQEKHGHRKKDGRFHHHRKHHWHRNMPHDIKHEEKDYRQKYGRAHSGS